MRQKDDVPPLENEGALSPTIVTGSEDSLSFSMDIDGIFGAISLSDFGSSFTLNLDIRVANAEIKTKTEYVAWKGLPTRLTDILHALLGLLDLTAGYASVYYMCPGY